MAMRDTPKTITGNKPTRTQRTLARVEAGDGVGNASRHKALAQGCPTCGALAHKSCISPKGDLRWAFHRDRRPRRGSVAAASAETAGIEGSASRRMAMDALTHGPADSDRNETPTVQTADRGR